MQDGDRARYEYDTPPVSRPVRDPRSHAVQLAIIDPPARPVRRGLPFVRLRGSYAHRLGCARRALLPAVPGPPHSPPCTAARPRPRLRGPRRSDRAGAPHGGHETKRARCGTADGDGLRGPWDGFVQHGRGHGGRMGSPTPAREDSRSGRSGRGGEGGGGGSGRGAEDVTGFRDTHDASDRSDWRRDGWMGGVRPCAAPDMCGVASWPGLIEARRLGPACRARIGSMQWPHAHA